MRKPKMTSYCVADAVSYGMSEIESLRDELQDWRDNLPESLQDSDKANTLDESIDALANVDYLNAPDCIENAAEDDDESTKDYVGGLRFEVVSRSKRRMSRRERRDEACEALRGAIDAIRQHVDDVQSKCDAEGEPLPDALDEATTFCDELENAIDEFDNAEFPGMYG